MLQRRLNKKVALIGSGVFMLVLLAAIAVVLQLGQDPQEAMADAEAALQAAKEAVTEQEKQENYKRAEHAFRRAYGGAKNNTLRKELLFKMVDMYLETGEWNYVLGCWEQIIKLDPDNAKARYGRLKYLYIIADNGGHGAWQQVHEQATEFLEVAEENGLLTEDTAAYEIPEMQEGMDEKLRLGPFLYLLRGRAGFEMARLGMVTNQDESLAQAIADLKKLQELDPNNILTFSYLARAVVTKGGIFAAKGNFQERDKATQEAIGLLEQAAELTDSNPRAHIELLALKLRLARDSEFVQLKERIRSLETEYLSLVGKFSSHAEAFAALSAFYAEYSTYAGPDLRASYFDKAIEAAEKAMELEEEKVVYAINAASLHYRRFSIYEKKEEMEQAIEIAKNALSLPGVKDTTGPWQRVHRNNRYGLHALLAHCYIEQVLDARGPAASNEVQDWLSAAEKAVHEIEQIFGSSEEPLAYKWKGMLELAKGNKDAAVRNLYQAYEQFTAVMPPTPPWPRDAEFAHLSYTLADIFRGTPETGAVLEFLIRAIYSGINEVKPEAYLDYVDILLELNHWAAAVQHINRFEEHFEFNQRSQMQRIQAFIGARQYGDAEEALAKRPADEADTIRLRLILTQERIRYLRLAATQKQRHEQAGMNVQRADSDAEESVDLQAEALQRTTDELRNYRQYEAELLEQLLAMDPNAVDESFFVDVCRHYIAQGQTDRAKRLVGRFSQAFPDNVAALVYDRILSEPDPAKVSQQRLKEIEEQVLSNAADPMLRALQLGIFYRRYNEPEKASRQFKQAFDTAMLQEHIPEGPAFERVKLAANHYLDMTIGHQDWVQAEEIVKAARTKDLDGCQGQVFAARLALAKGEFEKALTCANEYLKQKPVFSHGYMLRSHIHAALDNEHAAMEDIHKAASMNPLDGTIARGLASALYRRNQKLGGNVSDVQVAETKEALLRAIALNPGDLGLRSLYADYITPTEPLKAVAIRQDLLEADPSIENTILLGKLATEVAVRQDDPKTRQAMFDVAGSAFERAGQIAPNDKRMLYYYAEYFRARGQEEQAKALLQKSDDKTLLWDHYLQAGQYEEARTVLRELYDTGTRDSGVLRGLLLVAERTADKEGVKQYSEELVKSEDTLENNLMQIQAFLREGLIKEAEHKLQSFKEKYPNEPGSMLLQTWLAMRQGKLDEALDLANRNLQNDPENPTTWRLRGEINVFREDFDRAISDLRKSKMLSDEPATRISLAKAYGRMERYEEAVTELRNVVHAPGAPAEARFLLEQMYLQLDRRSELKTFYEETLEKFPDSAYWLNRAGSFALQTGEYNTAEEVFRRAFQIRRKRHPGPNETVAVKDVLSATALEGYLQSLIAGAGTPNTPTWNPAKVNRAVEEGQKHVDGPLACIAYLQIARAKLLLGDRMAAADSCRKAIDAAGADEMLASEVLMRTYTLLGAKEVEEYCRQKLQNDPDALAANLTMFHLASMNDDYDKAIEYINTCIAHIEPTDPRRADYILKKGEMLTKAYEESSDKNYLQAAIADYESLLTKMPNNTHVATVLNNLAYLLAENDEKLSEALRYAQRALDIKPNNPGILDTYAYVLLKNGNVSEAAKYLTAALQHFEQDRIPVPAEIFEHKGMIKEQLGAKQEARAAYEEALNVGEHSLSEKAKQRIERAVARISP
jgi:tetratricopeptide (TPR) repeat protein